MKQILTPLVALALTSSAFAAEPDTRCYELRTYHAAPGKMEELHKRFREHTLALFQKHGINSIGFWEQLDKENKPLGILTFLLSYPSRDAREASWKAFMADPDWQAAFKASEANGPLVEKFENPYLTATPYSPAIAPSKADEPRAFELRIYTCEPGRLNALHERFRNHTMGLFSKYGMTHFGYWSPMDKDQGAENTLVYLLAHKSREAATASFASFRNDPEWIAARKASEEKAGGSLTVKDGVQSVFMRPTDYSPTR
ncbi:MAG: NIPSNAP family protein [Verrucomicrobiota bacterium]